jgi:hypothetical protein
MRSVGPLGTSSGCEDSALSSKARNSHPGTTRDLASALELYSMGTQSTGACSTVVAGAAPLGAGQANQPLGASS